MDIIIILLALIGLVMGTSLFYSVSTDRTIREMLGGALLFLVAILMAFCILLLALIALKVII